VLLAGGEYSHPLLRFRHPLGLGVAKDPGRLYLNGNSICIAIQYCDFIAIPWSKPIAHHMSAAEGQESNEN
jgi:hypothetical protein